MGWGRTLLLGDVGNRLDIADVEQEVKRLQRQAAFKNDLDMAQEEQIAYLTAELAETKLYLKAMMQLLTDKGIVSSEDIRDMVIANELTDDLE